MVFTYLHLLVQDEFVLRRSSQLSHDLWLYIQRHKYLHQSFPNFDTCPLLIDDDILMKECDESVGYGT